MVVFLSFFVYDSTCIKDHTHMSYTLKFSQFLHTLNRYVQYLHKDVPSSVLDSYDVALQNMRSLPEEKQRSEYVRLVSDLTPLFVECQSAIAESLSSDSAELEIPTPFASAPYRSISTRPSPSQSASQTQSPSSEPALAPACAGAQDGTETEETTAKPSKTSAKSSSKTSDASVPSSFTVDALRERISHVEIDPGESYAVAHNPPIGTPIHAAHTPAPTVTSTVECSGASSVESSADDVHRNLHQSEHDACGASEHDTYQDDVEFDEDGDCVDFGYVLDDDETTPAGIPTSDPETGQTPGFGDAVDSSALPESLASLDEAISSIDSYHRHFRRTYTPNVYSNYHGICANRDHLIFNRPAETIDEAIRIRPVDVYCYLDNISEDAMKALMSMLLSLDRRRLAYNEFPLLMQWFRSRKRLYSIRNLSERDGRYRSGGIPLDDCFTVGEDNLHHKADINRRTYGNYRRKEIVAVMEALFGHDDTWSGYEELDERDIVNWNREFNTPGTFAVDGRKRRAVLSKEQILRHRQAATYLAASNLAYAHRITSREYDMAYDDKKKNSMPPSVHSVITYNERIESLNELFVPAELRRPITFVGGETDKIPYADRRKLIGDLALLSMDDKLLGKDLSMLSDGEVIKLYHLTESDTSAIVDALDMLPKKNVIALYYRLLCMSLDGRLADIRMKRYDETNRKMVEFDNLALQCVLNLCGEIELDSFASKYRIAMGMFVNEYAKRALGTDRDILEIQIPPQGLMAEDSHRIAVAFSAISSMHAMQQVNDSVPALNGQLPWDPILDGAYDPRDAVRDYSKLDSANLGKLYSEPIGKPLDDDADMTVSPSAVDGAASALTDIDAPIDISKHYDMDTLELLSEFSAEFRRIYIGIERSGAFASLPQPTAESIRSLADRIAAFSSKVDMYRTAMESDADRKYEEGERIYSEEPRDAAKFSTGKGKIRLTEEDVLDGRIRHTRVKDDPDWDPVKRCYRPGTKIGRKAAAKEKLKAEKARKAAKKTSTSSAKTAKNAKSAEPPKFGKPVLVTLKSPNPAKPAGKSVK